jgi:4-amino-4-deoxy-L-arabinose transferase-like glycosyltransferase
MRVKMRGIIPILVIAIGLRLATSVLLRNSAVDGLTVGYVETAASLASGHGLLMNADGPSLIGGVSVLNTMQALEQKKERIDSSRPFPSSTSRWIPATLHPPGYSLLLCGAYRLLNYSGMLVVVYGVQILADSAVCLLLLWLGASLFTVQVGRGAAWIYVVLPPAVLNCAVLKPDALGPFFAVAILAVAAYEARSNVFRGIATGLVVGMGVYFRSEILIFCAIVPALFVLYLPWRRALTLTLGVVVGVTLAMTPWICWTYYKTGTPLVSTSNTGGGLYQALGQDVDNPWGVSLDDGWMATVANRAGFNNAWTPAASVYFRRLFIEAVREHPMDYVRLVIMHRLPNALAVPYDSEWLRQDRFTFASFKTNEGLGVEGVIMKYPMKVLRGMWAEALMRLFALFLLCSVGYVCITSRYGLWLALPVVTVILSICLFKYPEARNLCTILPAEALAVSVLIDNMIAGRTSGQRVFDSAAQISPNR